jgi:hypothetical protein
VTSSRNRSKPMKVNAKAFACDVLLADATSTAPYVLAILAILPALLSKRFRKLNSEGPKTWLDSMQVRVDLSCRHDGHRG